MGEPKNYPVERGWVGEGLPWIGRPRRRLLEALGARADLAGGEATAPIPPDAANEIFEILRRRGNVPEFLVRMKRRELVQLAEGDQAVDDYVEELATPHRGHFHWPMSRASDPPRCSLR